MKVSSSAAINLIAQKLSYGICPFRASLPYVPDFRKKFCPKMWLKIAMKIEEFHVST